MLQSRWHVNPGCGLSFLQVVAQAHGRFALCEEQHRRFRRRVFRKLLALGESEDDRFDSVILKKRAAQDAVRRRFGFFGKIEDVGVGGGHGGSCVLSLFRFFRHPLPRKKRHSGMMVI